MKMFERLASVSAALAVVLLLAGLAAAPVRLAQAANNANVCGLGTCVGRGVPAGPTDPTGCTPAGVCAGPPRRLHLRRRRARQPMPRRLPGAARRPQPVIYDGCKKSARVES